jgi:rubrerythrin
MYKQIEDAIEFADAGQTPYTPEQVLSIAYQLVYRTGIFADDCKIWKRQAAPYKTWPQFKIDFALAYQEYNESLDIAPSAAGFHAQEIADQNDDTIAAIANLATATAEDRQAVANLTSTNATLTKELAASNGKLIAALTLVNTLTKQGKVSSTSTANNVPNARIHYCWTCGYLSEHSSWKCPTPATGHQTRAKAADTRNGSIKNKPP